jgi:hypothetical protein
MSTLTTARLDLRGLRAFEAWSDQFPFAISHALNKTAQLAAVALRVTLKDYFADRGKASAYVKRRLTITKVSSKRDLTVQVSSADDFMRAHAVGDDRPEGDRALSAVPLAMRQPKTRALGKRNEWPMALIRQGKAYRPGVDRVRKITATTTTSAAGKSQTKRTKSKPDSLEPGQIVLASRKNGTHSAGTPLWLIVADDQIKLDQVWPMKEIVEGEFASHWEQQLIRSMQTAIKTARSAGRR